MSPKRASGRHPVGSRTKAAGKPQVSGWAQYNAKLEKAEAQRVKDAKLQRLWAINTNALSIRAGETELVVVDEGDDPALRRARTRREHREAVERIDQNADFAAALAAAAPAAVVREPASRRWRAGAPAPASSCSAPAASAAEAATAETTSPGKPTESSPQPKKPRTTKSKGK